MILRIVLSVLVLLATANGVPSILGCGFVHLTVSSLQSWLIRTPSQYDRIELNWDLSACSSNDDSLIPDTISLFAEDPSSSNDTQPLATVLTKDHKWGYYITNVRLGRVEFPGGWQRKPWVGKRPRLLPPGSHCLPFWIASFKDDRLLRKNCLKIQPTWMFDIRDQIADQALTKMLLPGTHNAGSYEFSPVFVRDIFERFTLCQDVSIWSQLVSGIRYLDFRISYQELDQEKLWLSHGVIKVRPLLPLLYDIKTFLNSTTHEIVILDIHQLPVGFYESNDILMPRHTLLVDLLQEIFSEYIVDYAELMNSIDLNVGPKVSDILKTGKRLIIGYPDSRILLQTKWLWPAVSHMWGNTNDPHQLKSYLDGVMQSTHRPYALWSAMAQMTPTSLDVVLSDKSLRKMANDVNRNLTNWVKYEWYNRANIIASDFFMGNDVIDTSIYFNYIKGPFMKTDIGKIFYNRV